VEMELHLVTAEEMELNPVGMGRKDPERLPDPKYVVRLRGFRIVDNVVLHRAEVTLFYV